MLDFTITAVVSLLFLVDPPGTIPPFLALTASYPPRKRRKTAVVACAAATCVMTVFAVLGTYLFRYLGLTLPAFQIAGGLILFLVALDMIREKRTPAPAPEELVDTSTDAGDVAITPLAVPLLAGPAALSTVAVLMSRASNAGEVATPTTTPLLLAVAVSVFAELHVASDVRPMSTFVPSVSVASAPICTDLVRLTPHGEGESAMAETLGEDVDEAQPTPEREGKRKREAKRLRVLEFIRWTSCELWVQNGQRLRCLG